MIDHFKKIMEASEDAEARRENERREEEGERRGER